GREACVIAVSDGAASHEGSSLWSPERLARERPLESLRALRRLGLAPESIVRLGFADGGLTAHRQDLAARLEALFRPHDRVITTWRLDGHPDHEACGQAAAIAAERRGACLFEVPVWAWHWARPGDARLPWSRARQLALDASIVQRKTDAVQSFASQLAADPSTGRGPILRSTTVARAARPFEIYLS
ncbi:MAG: PIG-L family deacetylase, partial [Gammaproteobacteria bacterium]|nr:PIG-L family deacetylase [Gammaproteobacteria bacterium]